MKFIIGVITCSCGRNGLELVTKYGGTRLTSHKCAGRWEEGEQFLCEADMAELEEAEEWVEQARQTP